MKPSSLTSFTPDYRDREVCPPHLWTIGSDHHACASCDHWVVSECHVSVDQLYPAAAKLPPDVDSRVRAELHDLHVLDRAAAPDPEDVIATMRANGLHDPERD